MKTKTVAEVINLANNLHSNQKYGDKPYSYHLEDVYRTYKYLFGHVEDEIVMAIFLHDSIEDCDIDGQYLSLSGVPSSVLTLVEILTKWKDESRLEYLSRVMENEAARMIKAADSHSNLVHSFKGGNERLIKKYTENLAILLKEI